MGTQPHNEYGIKAGYVALRTAYGERRSSTSVLTFGTGFS